MRVKTPRIQAGLSVRSASKAIILRMGPDPEPHDLLALTDAERPMSQGDPDREDWSMWVNLLEL